MNVFIWNAPATTDRDLKKLAEAGFGWQKSLFQWRLIEPAKGIFDWAEADRVVQASNAAGIQVITRVDFQPQWSRSDGAPNGPPDRYEDLGEFIFALVQRYAPGSPFGAIGAVELWNEPNLGREWGDQSIDRSAAESYVQLLCTGYQAAKRASPNVVVLSAGLTPNGLHGGPAMDDAIYLQWMYEAGARPCFDALGAHGAGFRAPPWTSPDELASEPRWGGHASFGFRRVEQLRSIMVRNGDGDKQVWLTEFGWTSDTVHPEYSHASVTEEQKAEYVVEAYRWAYLNWQPWVGVMVLWTMPAPDWTDRREEFWWSITNPDGSPRPAYEALVTARRSGYLP